MKVIVAAFEPFGGRKRNRAERAARRLADEPEVFVATLPTSFARLPAALDALLLHTPNLLLLVGESRRARALEVERSALNLADARIADNDGAQPQAQPIEPGGPLARAVGFPVDAVVAAHRGRRRVRDRLRARWHLLLQRRALPWARSRSRDARRLRPRARTPSSHAGEPSCRRTPRGDRRAHRPGASHPRRADAEERLNFI